MVASGGTADGVTLRVGDTTQWFPRGDVVSAERLKDASSRHTQEQGGDDERVFHRARA
jgi:hypothetical protein